MNKLLATAAAAAAMCVTVAAQAAPIVGTGSFGSLGVTAVPGSGNGEVIGVGSTFNFAFVGWGGGTGDLAAVPVMTVIGTAPITASLAAPVAFNIPGWGSFAGSVTQASQQGPAANRIVDLFALGTFTPTFGGFTPGPMSMTWSATQTGPVNPNQQRAISVSWTIASPPVPIPEPMSLALVGAGLLGAGLASRRRKA